MSSGYLSHLDDTIKHLEVFSLLPTIDNIKRKLYFENY